RHTRSTLKYLIRLFLFGIISEVPFDLALHAKYVDWKYQNVYWTLFLGLLAITGLRFAKERIENKVLQTIVRILSVGITASAAWFFKTDYHAVGVLTIVIMDLYIENYTYSMTFGCAMLMLSNQIEISAFAAVPLVSRYNGQRGLKSKYFFYAFYPLHFAVLAVICHLMGLIDLTRWH
ncbi:MAG: conjugal transfer protein TraX, partial [Lachnospiraceae bacterium]|nr:conjugal transfer protein TraX [Lachnospiraceae bacterium]